MPTWRHLRQIAPCPLLLVSDAGHSVACDSRVTFSWTRDNIYGTLDHPNSTLYISFMDSHGSVRTKQTGNKSECSFLPISVRK